LSKPQNWLLQANHLLFIAKSITSELSTFR
jgi:hypothetical protein